MQIIRLGSVVSLRFQAMLEKFSKVKNVLDNHFQSGYIYRIAEAEKKMEILKIFIDKETAIYYI